MNKSHVTKPIYLHYPVVFNYKVKTIYSIIIIIFYFNNVILLPDSEKVFTSEL